MNVGIQKESSCWKVVERKEPVCEGCPARPEGAVEPEGVNEAGVGEQADCLSFRLLGGCCSGCAAPDGSVSAVSAVSGADGSCSDCARRRASRLRSAAFEHHFQSGCARKCASFTSLASIAYSFFLSAGSAYHCSPRILLIVLLSWFG